MSRFISFATAGMIVLSLARIAAAQPVGGLGGMAGGAPSGPNFSGALRKVFGQNQSFTAAVESKMSNPASGQTVEMPGKMSFHEGKTAVEIDMSKAKSAQFPPQILAQMKMLGMAEMKMISLPNTKEINLIYPGIKSYIAMPVEDPSAGVADDQFKLESTELGKEKVGEYDTAKNKVVITGPDGEKTEAIIWNAAKLKDFPIRIQYSQNGAEMTTTFKNVEFGKPEESIFLPPQDFTRYDNMTAFLQGLMKKFTAPPAGRQPEPLQK